ncbi:thiamine-phosphate kinase [Spiribacter sp. C176]|uniref:Thiamine-monophosphate kinase n=1 Tax=Spiribacter salilacus TaxID=2664894 RepID=A0A6N7QR25_9GAMM|nr:thiamine-phosphate kinase [Spiribacter salilacus]MRH77853.1 thiamine-phosphate kinase [Spiribacter salilacus]
MQGCSEFDLIARHLSRLGTHRDDVLQGVGDDAAIVATTGEPLAMALDTIVQDVHFPADLPARCVGWRALAVNLSDLAAMAAKPCWGLLGLTLPAMDEAWVEQFAAGLHALACQHELALIGGDITRGPLSVTVQVTGRLPHQPLRRAGVQPGDRIWVSGQLGEAAAGLARWQADGSATIDEPVVQRFLYPTPRVALGLALQGLATAAIDISDGLLADAGHLARQSDVALVLDSTRLLAQVSDAVSYEAVLRGGDDYELCFAAPPDADKAVKQAAQATQTLVTCIGQADFGAGVWLDNERVDLRTAGYQHF